MVERSNKMTSVSLKWWLNCSMEQKIKALVKGF